MSKCSHPTIRRYIREKIEWDGEECLADHTVRGKSSQETACWHCPECGRYVSWQEREKMKDDE